MKYVLRSPTGVYIGYVLGHTRTLKLSLAYVLESKEKAELALTKIFNTNNKYIYNYCVVCITEQELFKARLGDK